MAACAELEPGTTRALSWWPLPDLPETVVNAVRSAKEPYRSHETADRTQPGHLVTLQRHHVRYGVPLQAPTGTRDVKRSCLRNAFVSTGRAVSACPGPGTCWRDSKPCR